MVTRPKAKDYGEDLVMRDDLNRANLMSNRTLHEGPRRDATDAVELEIPEPMTYGDNLSNGLKVWLDVGLKLGKQIEEQKARIDRAVEKLQRNTPVDYTVTQYGVYASPGPLVLNIGSPDIGTYWEVESVIIGGTEVNVTAAGKAGLYVTAVPTVAGLGLSNCVDIAASLPNAGFYGRRDIVVTAQENLVVAIYSGTAGQGYIASASVTVLNVAAAQGNDVVSI
jgi:hypothetical protein